MKFRTDFQSKERIFCDSNAYLFVERQRNFKDSFKVSIEEPAAQNFYPINAYISIMNFNASNTIKSQRTELFTVLNDRSQAGASVHDGDLELMIQRRNFLDDKKGLK